MPFIYNGYCLPEYGLARIVGIAGAIDDRLPSPDFNHAVFFNSAIFCIVDFQPFGIHTFRVLERRPYFLPIFGKDFLVISDRMNVFILINILMFRPFGQTTLMLVCLPGFVTCGRRRHKRGILHL